MKIFIPFLLLCLVATQLSAQISRGTIMLGGTAGVNNASADGNSYTTIDVDPLFGYFLGDRFALGASVNLSVFLGEDVTSTSFGFNPFARYYFNTSGTALLFGQAHVGYQNFGENEFGDDLSALNYGLGVGVDFFLNDHVAIEGVLGYRRQQNTDDSDDALNHIGLNFGVAAFIGGGGGNR